MERESQEPMLASLFDSGVWQVNKKKKWTKKEFKFREEIDNLEVDDVTLDLGLEVNIFPKTNWENMGNPRLVWSPI